MGTLTRTRRRREFARKLAFTVVFFIFCTFALVNYQRSKGKSTDASEQSPDDNVMNLILSALGSRNTTAFVKPGQNTLLFDSLILVANNPDKTDNDNRIESLQADPVKPPLFALVVVISEIGHEEERHVIRETWYKWTEKENVRVVFFLGVPPNQDIQNSGINDEVAEFNDVVVDDFEENYYLLSAKVLRMFKWFTTTYPHEGTRPKFLIKVDHDVFLNIPNLVKHLKREETQHNVHSDYIGGRLASSTGVKHNAREDSFIPTELLPDAGYPDYLVGGCYFLQSAVVPRIYEASLGEQLFIFEDIFLTGMIAHDKLGIQLHDVNPAGIVIAPTFAIRLFGWDSKTGIAYHPANAKLMKQYFEEANKV
ncbi:unnamed protein product [Allacma fusca]|uniref:Hexosyltransferase n=1 Tax=Allacma fusca TaxID=39272 RepID=A0A8J2LUC6_9HEXA|nr:unnamed protein product [Allacma fusca]